MGYDIPLWIWSRVAYYDDDVDDDDDDDDNVDERK